MPTNSRERRRADGVPLSATHIVTTRQLGLCASVYNADNVPLPLSPSLNTCTRSTPPPPSTAPSLLPQAVQPSETHTRSRRGVRPAPLLLCALVTKEFWLPLPSFLISRLSHVVFLTLHSWKRNALYWEKRARSCYFNYSSHLIQLLASSFHRFLLGHKSSMCCQFSPLRQTDPGKILHLIKLSATPPGEPCKS